MLTFTLFLLIYLLTVFRLDQHYSNRYFWDEDCGWQQFWSSIGQPIMELFGNSMIAHFWCFETIRGKIIIPSHCRLQIPCQSPPFRRFNRGLETVLRSAWVDVNPNQLCAIVQPVDYIGRWKIFFQTGGNTFQEAKFSHTGAVKVVVDGSGQMYGRDLSGVFIELEILQNVKAWQRTDILMV